MKEIYKNLNHINKLLNNNNKKRRPSPYQLFDSGLWCKAIFKGELVPSTIKRTTKNYRQINQNKLNVLSKLFCKLKTNVPVVNDKYDLSQAISLYRSAMTHKMADGMFDCSHFVASLSICNMFGTKLINGLFRIPAQLVIEPDPCETYIIACDLYRALAILDETIIRGFELKQVKTFSHKFEELDGDLLDLIVMKNFLLDYMSLRSYDDNIGIILCDIQKHIALDFLAQSHPHLTKHAQLQLDKCQQLYLHFKHNTQILGYKKETKATYIKEPSHLKKPDQDNKLQDNQSLPAPVITTATPSLAQTITTDQPQPKLAPRRNSDSDVNKKQGQEYLSFLWTNRHLQALPKTKVETKPLLVKVNSKRRNSDSNLNKKSELLSNLWTNRHLDFKTNPTPDAITCETINIRHK
jgi:hypothetical protein